MVEKKKKYKEKYVPKSLSPADRKKQIKSITEKTIRPKLDSVKSKRSRNIIKYENQYGTKINDDKFINTNIISQTVINKIQDKGKGAYMKYGSKQNKKKNK